MDPKSRRIVWLCVGALGIGLILEGAASAIALARFGTGAHHLVQGATTLPAWTNTPPAPDGYASRSAPQDRQFGHWARYTLPGGKSVDCRFFGPVARCTDGWRVASSD